jgi:hypothetical protein
MQMLDGRFSLGADLDSYQDATSHATAQTVDNYPAILIDAR